MGPSIILKVAGAALVLATWIVGAIESVPGPAKLILLALGATIGFLAVRTEGRRWRNGSGG